MTRLPSLVLLSTALSTVVIAGCDTRARFRVSEVEIKTDQNGQIQRTKQELSYNSKGELEEIETKAEGQLQRRLELTYENGRIVEAKVVRASGSPTKLEAEYTGALLTELTGETGSLSWTVDFSYFNNNIRLPDEIVYEISAEDGRIEIEATHGYDDKSRLKSLEQVRTESPKNGQSSTTTLDSDYRYAENGTLQRLQQVQKSGNQSATAEVEYSFDEQGRLEEVENDDLNYTYSVEYDDKGRIVEIERLGGGSKVTTEYSYDDGTSTGYSFQPNVPGSLLLDLAGRTQPNVDVFSPSYFDIF